MQADEKSVEKLKWIQNEIRELHKAQAVRDAEIESRKTELETKCMQLREQETKIISLRALLESVEEQHRRQLIQAKTGRADWFREDPDDPECHVEVTRNGEVYRL